MSSLDKVDIQSWRRNIPDRPASRPLPSPQGTPIPSRASSPGGVPLRTVKSAASLSTLARPAVARLSSFLSTGGRSGSSNGSPSKASSVWNGDDDWLGFNRTDVTYNPDLDEMADQLLRIGMNLGNRGLGVEHTGLLMHVLEGYRKNMAKIQGLNEELGREKKKSSDIMLAYEAAILSWEEEKLVWEREVKRLEKLIADGNDGMEALILARAGSLIQKEKAEWEARKAKLQARAEELKGREKHENKSKILETKPMLVVGNDDVEQSRGLSPMRPSEFFMTGRPPQGANFDLAKLGLSPFKDDSVDDLDDVPARRPPLVTQDSIDEFPYTQANWSSNVTSSSSELGDKKSSSGGSDIERLGLDIPQYGRLATLRAHGQSLTSPRSTQAHRRDYSFTPGDEQVFLSAERERLGQDDNKQSASKVAGLMATPRAQHELRKDVKEQESSSKEKVKNEIRAGHPRYPLTSETNSFPELKGPQPKRYSHPRIAALDELASSFDIQWTPERDNSANSIVTVKRASRGIHGSLPGDHSNFSIRDTDPNALTAAKAALGSSKDPITSVFSASSGEDERNSPSTIKKSRKQID